MIREKGTNKTWKEFYELYDKIADKLYKCAEKQLKDKTSDHSCTWIWDIDECTLAINDIKKDGHVIGIEISMLRNFFKDWIGSIQYYNEDFVDELHYDVAGHDKEHVITERDIRAAIQRALAKEICGNTTPNVMFIKKVLEDAYSSGIKYDVSDMKEDVTIFASLSLHQSKQCLNMVSQMPFKSKDEDFVDELNYGVAEAGCSESVEDAKKKLNSLYGRYSMYRKTNDYSFQQMYPIDYKSAEDRDNKTWEKEKTEE